MKIIKYNFSDLTLSQYEKFHAKVTELCGVRHGGYDLGMIMHDAGKMTYPALFDTAISRLVCEDLIIKSIEDASDAEVCVYFSILGDTYINSVLGMDFYALMPKNVKNLEDVHVYTIDNLALASAITKIASPEIAQKINFCVKEFVLEEVRRMYTREQIFEEARKLSMQA